jgi:hypothetical protein
MHTQLQPKDGTEPAAMQQLANSVRDGKKHEY